MAGTIVYVDGEPELPPGLGRELGKLGFRLEETTDVEAALARVREGAARLVMVEILLDGGRGWWLIQQIRALEGPPGEIPIVVLTRAERTPKLYGRAVELGADDFLARPVVRAEILGAILECVESCEAGPPVDPGLARPGSAGVAEASGDLADFPLPELLLHLREEAATGVLFLQDFEGLVVQLRNGSPIGVASSRGAETFAEFLMRTKRISGQEHEALLERVHATGESEAEAAASIGALSPADVRAALADRSAEPLLEAFAWTGGSWRFEPGRRIRSAQALERGAARILAQGVLQWTPSRSIRAMLDRRGALYLSKVERPACALQDLSPSPCEPELLDGWLGEQTVAEVLESGAIGERELYALLVAGLAEASDQTLLELDQVVEAAPAAREAPPPLRDRLPEVRKPPEAAPAPRRATAGEDTSAPAPEAVAPSAPADAATAGAAGASRERSAAERARDAELHFAQGEAHLAARRYDRAVESFGMAAHLDPDQGEYRAHLGYAMHLQSPDLAVVRREALEHIAKGVKLAGEQWKPLVFLARVLIAADERSNARKILRGALRRHPDCEPLRAELRKLGRRESEPKPAGLLARLRRRLGI